MTLRRVTCPTCRREIDWAQTPFRPFCSDRCRLIDLGAWMSEQRGIPGEAAPVPEPGTDSQGSHDPSP